MLAGASFGPATLSRCFLMDFIKGTCAGPFNTTSKYITLHGRIHCSPILVSLN